MKYFRANIFGETVVTAVGVVNISITEWIAKAIAHYDSPELIVGIDIIKRSPSDGTKPIDTLHLCVGHHCLIYAMHPKFVPRSLGNFLSDPRFLFVGFGITSNMEQLQEEFGIGGMSSYVDLETHAKLLYNKEELSNAGLSQLANVLIVTKLSKRSPEVMTDWSYDDLPKMQLFMGTIIPYACSLIGKRLGLSRYKF